MRIPEHFYADNEDCEIEEKANLVGYDAAIERLDTLSAMLKAGAGERKIQRYLCRHPYLLLGRCRTGHGTYAFKEKLLGCQHRIDWAVANGNSGGLAWELIELESPLRAPFMKNGHFSAATREGINQILDWRNWLAANPDYAERSKSSGGLSLHGIRYNHGVVVVGRRSHYDQLVGRDKYDVSRQVCKRAHHIDVISYETFLESLRFRFQREASLDRGGMLSCHPS